jgi:hypothetical protein
MKSKYSKILSTLKYSVIFLLIFGCSNSNEETITEVSGVDYRPLLGQDLYGNEVRAFFINNEITFHKDYMRIKTERGSDIITDIFFGESCPAQYLPFGSNHFLNEEMAINKYGEPDFIFNRTYAYESLNLVIQFASNGKDVDDIGIASTSSIKEAKKMSAQQ